MNGPTISITLETYCLDCCHCKSREPAVDDLFQCDLLPYQVAITPYKTPRECPHLLRKLNEKLAELTKDLDVNRISYYEPKTNTFYRNKPRERNVYRVVNSAKFRRALSSAKTPGELVAVLEEYERSACGE